MSAHMQGPWTANPDPEWPGEFNIRDRHGCMITHINCYGGSDENARLIAAAPDLLEALLALHAIAWDGEEIDVRLDKIARAAIAKATG